MAHRGGFRRTTSVAALALALPLTLTALTGCASTLTDANPAAATAPAPSSSTTATTAANDGADPGCTAALKDISTYGPSTVKLLAEGREAVTAAAVQLLVDGLDSAADAANSPQTHQAIETLATAYDDYFNLTTDAVAIPLSTLLKDTANLEFVCR